MKILHTSGWHIGRALHGRKRYAKFEVFLNWMAESIGKAGSKLIYRNLYSAQLGFEIVLL